eukprot:TRINITY_DN24330_c0_g1_i1.p2 TRINITY_DN24330_c0_g1~~TRINITY_DN24330_c0_g1_i1.p2  ORF type:complete len:101 (-),score=23.07 TRINITY_DN24330_c0_g1_i1:232-534(-)
MCIRDRCRNACPSSDAGRGSVALCRAAEQALVDFVLQDMACTEDEHATRLDRDFLTRLRIASDTAALFPHLKAAEGRNLYSLAICEVICDLHQNGINQFR